MYVCLCNAYRDADIRELAQAGVRCAREAYLTLGSGPRCGNCLGFAQVMIDRIHEERRLHGKPSPYPEQAAVKAIRP